MKKIILDNKTFDYFMDKCLQDPEINKEYKLLKPKYDKIRKLIKHGGAMTDYPQKL